MNAFSSRIVTLLFPLFLFSCTSQEYVNYLLSTFLVMLKAMEQNKFTSDTRFAFEASVLNFILITGDLMKQKVSPRDFLKTSTPFELSALETIEEYEKARELDYWSKFRSFVAKRLKTLEKLPGMSKKNINEINYLKSRAMALL